jgi:molecular chaperone DnaK (HSP70)
MPSSLMINFSYISFYTGDAAKNQVAINASNTVFDAKRLIGRKFQDKDVQKDMKHWYISMSSYNLHIMIFQLFLYSIQQAFMTILSTSSTSIHLFPRKKKG